MPVERKTFHLEKESEEALVKALVEEYKLGEASPNKEPRIVLQETSLPNVSHVYVVWSRWAGMPQNVRSRLIMEAMEQVLPPEEMYKVTLAWGLTQEEWKQYKVGDVG